MKKKHENSYENNKLLLNIIKILLIIFISIAIFGLLGYGLNFFGLVFSNMPSDYGSFGSFFGGLISPIIIIFTALIVYRLTTHTNIILDKQKKLSEEQNKNQLEQQRKLKTTELQHELINEFLKKMDVIYDVIETKDEYDLRNKKHYTMRYIEMFIERFEGAFQILYTEEFDELIKNTKKIFEIIQDNILNNKQDDSYFKDLILFEDIKIEIVKKYSILMMQSLDVEK